MAKRVRFGGFEADFGSGELFRGATRIALQRQPFQLLEVLIDHAGELVTRDELRAQLWSDGTVVDFEHSLNTAVRKIRRALGDSPKHPRFIETIAGHGYRLCAPVEWVRLRSLRQPDRLYGLRHREPAVLYDALRSALCAAVLALSEVPEKDRTQDVSAALARGIEALHHDGDGLPADPEKWSPFRARRTG